MNVLCRTGASRCQVSAQAQQRSPVWTNGLHVQGLCTTVPDHSKGRRRRAPRMYCADFFYALANRRPPAKALGQRDLNSAAWP
mmetsp:Transcript_9561/g.27443  ORF Transcript_9561/g.27443 Transcript_9561/m.27443 type:complete len:83 (-) Transcript_9561:6-254(-)